MPEIAEVRTVARTLNKKVLGRKIIGIDTPYDKIIDGDVDNFKKSVIDKYITNVDFYIFRRINNNVTFTYGRKIFC